MMKQESDTSLKTSLIKNSKSEVLEYFRKCAFRDDQNHDLLMHKPFIELVDELFMDYAATPAAFKFDLSQLVDMRISSEWGEVRGRAQYVNAENQYFVHFRAADGRACSQWFDESQLGATEDERHPGCPVYAGIELPEGAVAEE